MKSAFRWKSALLFVASMPLLSSAFAAEIALAIGPAESPRGNGVSVTPLSVQRTVDLHNPTVSTFLVTFAPGGSVVLHGAPSAGYVLVHVLSGAVTAWAWQAQVGIYRSGETWAEPTFAYDIATRNASTHEPAEALVVLITEDAND